jgi:hypothetical protein
VTACVVSFAPILGRMLLTHVVMVLSTGSNVCVRRSHLDEVRPARMRRCVPSVALVRRYCASRPRHLHVCLGSRLRFVELRVPRLASTRGEWIMPNAYWRDSRGGRGVWTIRRIISSGCRLSLLVRPLSTIDWRSSIPI